MNLIKTVCLWIVAMFAFSLGVQAGKCIPLELEYYVITDIKQTPTLIDTDDGPKWVLLTTIEKEIEVEWICSLKEYCDILDEIASNSNNYQIGDIIELHTVLSQTTYHQDVDCADPDSWPTSDSINPGVSSCSPKSTLYCNRSISGRTQGSGSTNAVDSYTQCYEHRSGYVGKEDIYKINAGSAVTIDLYSHSSYGSPDMFFIDGCSSSGGFGSNICAAGSPVANVQKSAYLSNVSYHYDAHVVLDQKSTSPSNYELVMSCGSPCDGGVKTIECGTTIKGTTKGNYNHSSWFSCDPHGNQGHNWGPEETYKIQVNQVSELHLYLEVNSGEDLNLYLLRGSCQATSCVETSKKIGSGQDEYIIEQVYPGTYYIVVEGYRGSSGSYELSVSGCGCTDGTLACDRPVEGNIAGADNDFEMYNCNGQTSGRRDVDRSYEFTARETGRHRFILSGMESNSNLDLYLVTPDCDEYRCLASSRRVSNSMDFIDYDMDKGDKVFAIVEKAIGNSKFMIEVQCDPGCFDRSEEYQTFNFFPSGEENEYYFDFYNNIESAQNIRWTQNGKSFGEGQRANAKLLANRVEICVQWDTGDPLLCDMVCKDISREHASTPCESIVTELRPEYDNPYFFTLRGSTPLYWNLIGDSRIIDQQERVQTYHYDVPFTESILLSTVYYSSSKRGYTTCTQQTCLDEFSTCDSDQIRPIIKNIETQGDTVLYTVDIQADPAILSDIRSYQVTFDNDAVEIHEINGQDVTIAVPNAFNDVVADIEIYKMQGQCPQSCSRSLLLDSLSLTAAEGSEISVMCNSTYQWEVTAEDSLEIRYILDTEGKFVDVQKDTVLFSSSNRPGDYHMDVIFEDCRVGCALKMQRVTVQSCIQEIRCGELVSSTTVDKRSDFGNDDYSCWNSRDLQYNRYRYELAGDAIFAYHKQDSSDVLDIHLLHDSTDNLSMFILDENLDGVGYLADQRALGHCKAHNFNTIKERSNAGKRYGEVYTDINRKLPAGLYYIIIDGDQVGAEADFELIVSCMNTLCGEVPIECGDNLVNQQIIGTDSRMSLYQSKDSTDILPGYTSAELTYSFVLEEDDSVIIQISNLQSLTNRTADVDLFILDQSCKQNAVVAYSNSQSPNELLEVYLPAGSYTLVVDQFLSNALVTFDLNFETGGCQASEQLVSKTNTKSATNRDVFQVFPNPFSDEVNVSIVSSDSDLETIRLLDWSGRVLYTKDMAKIGDSNQFVFDNSVFGNHYGVFILEAVNGNEIRRQRILRIK